MIPIELFDHPKDEDLLLNKNLEILQEVCTAIKANKNNSLSTNSTASSFEQEKIGFKSFQIIKLLGAGAFGKVYLARKKNSDKRYALKILKKRQLISKNQVKYAVSEVNILKKMDHPFILSLYYAFQVIQIF